SITHCNELKTCNRPAGALRGTTSTPFEPLRLVRLYVGLSDIASRVSCARIAPGNLRYSDQRQDRAVQGPSLVTGHEAEPESKVETLQNPDTPKKNHGQAEQGAYGPHNPIEYFPHVVLSSCAA